MTHTHTHTHTALWNLSGKTRVSEYQKKHSPTTLIVVINHPYQLSPSSTKHDSKLNNSVLALMTIYVEFHAPIDGYDFIIV